MNNEPKKVDVLAVIDRQIASRPDIDLERAKAGRPGAAQDLLSARTAVFELIEAVKHLRSCSGDERADPGSKAEMRLDAAKDRVDAALARVEGKA